MNDLLFPVYSSFTTAASVVPYSGGYFVVCQRDTKTLKINQINQLTQLLTKFNSL